MRLDEIKKIFEKLELFPTLYSIGILLAYINDESITSVFNMVFAKKYEQCSKEGINEYDYVSQILNFDISEFNKNIDEFTQTELLFIRRIINTTLLRIEKNELATKLIPILNEYKNIGTDKYIEEIKIENFFNKYNVNELYLFDIVLSYSCDLYIQKYKRILNKVCEEKEKKVEADIHTDCSFSNLVSKNNQLNDDELRFFYELVEDASAYLSSVQDYSYVYEQIMDDFDINEYPIITLYTLEESLLQEIENRNGKTKQR